MFRFFNGLFISVDLFTLFIIAVIAIVLGFHLFPITSYIIAGAFLAAILAISFEEYIQPKLALATKLNIIQAFKAGLKKGLEHSKK
ncbi:hypothetical protein [Pasteurella dagmatis]|uniref:Uncharacterized protein n=1 Tax=Pasteurella dagmatis ATCC 43325 TaxID=667128 RepID=C9PS24_9PAST|nr:hypothetical protein [Pasteurella dagmatis]EEX49751.1 hypothetical protein HMPREF0621_1798 [Pasteurella dagmatis ATCC 43325]SNV70887.1 Uncharacterised protein [Pasteurella dagmatis]